MRGKIVEGDAKLVAIAAVQHWDAERFATWLREGVTDYQAGKGRRAFYPFQHYVENNETLTEDLVNMHDSLPEEGRACFRQGLLLALECSAGKLQYELDLLCMWFEENDSKKPPL